MNARYASALIFLMLLSCFCATRSDYFASHASSTYPVHNLNSGLNYTTIGEAIGANETLPGDTIFVESGVYNESLSVGKQLHLVGEDRDTTIIDGNMANEVLWLFQDVSVTNFTIRHGLYGIRMQVGISMLPKYGGIKVINNRIEGALYCGIILEKASDNTIIDNIISNNMLSGIHLSGSANNTIINNAVFGNGHGIDLYGYCRGNILRNNSIFDNAYNFGLIWYGDTVNWLLDERGRPNTVNDIDASNTVNGKPIYCWTNRSDEQIPSNAGFVWLTDCDNITVENLDLSNNIEGLMLAGTTNTLIYNNSITRNAYGVHLSLFSHNNTFVNNTLRDNDNGMYLGEFASNTIMRNNTISGGSYNFGVPLWYPGYIGWSYTFLNATTAGLDDIDLSNTVDGKSIVWWVDQHNIRVPSNVGYVVLVNCTDITVEGLSLSNNMQNVLLVNSNNTLISNNSISDSVNGIWVKGLSVQSSSGGYVQPSVNNTIVGCTLLENGIGCKVEKGDCTILNNTFYKNPIGIEAENITDSTIAGNTVTGSRLNITFLPLDISIFSHPFQHWQLDTDLLLRNAAGILFGGRSNVIYDNTIEDSSWGVIAGYRGFANGNMICHNYFINNTQEAREPYLGSNSWDLGYPSGGNYWSDYSGTDNFSGPNQNETGGDGIGDTTFSTGQTTVLDHYPLIAPYQDFFDISVSDSWASNAILSGNRQIMNVSITVTNLSIKGETFNVTLQANSTTISTFPNISLAIGKSINITYEWDVTSLTYGRYLINASAMPVPNENRISDNARAVLIIYTIFGDLNVDGTVNKDDAEIFANLYGLTQNQPTWISNADFNGDGSIDILDAIILGNNFGRTW